MLKERYYKVKYGYGVMDFISIPEKELARAINAWKNNLLYDFADKMVKGAEIKTIEPHYHRYTGWNEGYEPKDSEDYRQIKRDCPEGILEGIEGAKQFLLDGGKPNEFSAFLLENKPLQLKS